MTEVNFEGPLYQLVPASCRLNSQFIYINTIFLKLLGHLLVGGVLDRANRIYEQLKRKKLCKIKQKNRNKNLFKSNDPKL